MLNEEGQYLSHSDAEPIHLKKPVRKMHGAQAAVAQSMNTPNNLGIKGQPQSGTKLRAAGAAILSESQAPALDLDLSTGDHVDAMRKGVNKIMVAVR
jgi:hypothetical protein